MTFLIPGGMLLGSILGVFGVLRTKPMLMTVSFIILSLESPSLMFDGFFAFALIPAVFFLLGARTKVLFR